MAKFYESPFESNPYDTATGVARRAAGQNVGPTTDVAAPGQIDLVDPYANSWVGQTTRSLAQSTGNDFTNGAEFLVRGLAGDEIGRRAAAEDYLAEQEKARAMGPDIQSFDDAAAAGGGVGDYGAALAYTAAGMVPDLVATATGVGLGGTAARLGVRYGVRRGIQSTIESNAKRQAAERIASDQAQETARKAAVAAGSQPEAVANAMRVARAQTTEAAQDAARQTAVRLAGRTPAKHVIDQAEKWGGRAGGTLGAIPPLNGEANAEKAAAEGTTTGDMWALAAGTGAAAATQLVPLERFLGRFGGEAKKQVADKARGFLASTGKEAATQAGFEGGQEVVQQALQNASHAYVEENWDALMGPEAFDQYMVSFLAGGVMGGALGASGEVGKGFANLAGRGLRKGGAAYEKLREQVAEKAGRQRERFRAAAASGTAGDAKDAAGKAWGATKDAAGATWSAAKDAASSVRSLFTSKLDDVQRDEKFDEDIDEETRSLAQQINDMLGSSASGKMQPLTEPNAALMRSPLLQDFSKLGRTLAAHLGPAVSMKEGVDAVRPWIESAEKMFYGEPLTDADEANIDQLGELLPREVSRWRLFAARPEMQERMRAVRDDTAAREKLNSEDREERMAEELGLRPGERTPRAELDPEADAQDLAENAGGLLDESEESGYGGMQARSFGDNDFDATFETLRTTPRGTPAYLAARRAAVDKVFGDIDLVGDAPRDPKIPRNAGGDGNNYTVKENKNSGELDKRLASGEAIEMEGFTMRNGDPRRRAVDLAKVAGMLQGKNPGLTGKALAQQTLAMLHEMDLGLNYDTLQPGTWRKGGKDGPVLVDLTADDVAEFKLAAKQRAPIDDRTTGATGPSPRRPGWQVESALDDPSTGPAIDDETRTRELGPRGLPPQTVGPDGVKTSSNGAIFDVTVRDSYAGQLGRVRRLAEKGGDPDDLRAAKIAAGREIGKLELDRAMDGADPKMTQAKYQAGIDDLGNALVAMRYYNDAAKGALSREPRVHETAVDKEDVKRDSAEAVTEDIRKTIDKAVPEAMEFLAAMAQFRGKAPKTVAQKKRNIARVKAADALLEMVEEDRFPAATAIEHIITVLNRAGDVLPAKVKAFLAVPTSAKDIDDNKAAKGAAWKAMSQDERGLAKGAQALQRAIDDIRRKADDLPPRAEPRTTRDVEGGKYVKSKVVERKDGLAVVSRREHSGNSNEILDALDTDAREMQETESALTSREERVAAIAKAKADNIKARADNEAVRAKDTTRASTVDSRKHSKEGEAKQAAADKLQADIAAYLKAGGKVFDTVGAPYAEAIAAMRDAARTDQRKTSRNQKDKKQAVRRARAIDAELGRMPWDSTNTMTPEEGAAMYARAAELRAERAALLSPAARARAAEVDLGRRIGMAELRRRHKLGELSTERATTARDALLTKDDIALVYLARAEKGEFDVKTKEAAPRGERPPRDAAAGPGPSAPEASNRRPAPPSPMAKPTDTGKASVAGGKLIKPLTPKGTGGREPAREWNGDAASKRPQAEPPANPTKADIEAMRNEARAQERAAAARRLDLREKAAQRVKDPKPAGAPPAKKKGQSEYERKRAMREEINKKLQAAVDKLNDRLKDEKGSSPEGAPGKHDLKREQDLVNELLTSMGFAPDLILDVLEGDESHGEYSRGKRTIYMNPRTKGAERMEVLMHELGHHIVYATIAKHMDPDVTYRMTLQQSMDALAEFEPKLYAELRKDFDAYLAKIGKPKMSKREALLQRKPLNRAMREADLLKRGKDGGAVPASFFEAEGFHEWMADHLARALTTQKAPKTIIEKFFADIAAKLKQLWSALTKHGKTKFKAAPSVEAWVKQMFSAEHAAVREVTGQSAPQADVEGTLTAGALVHLAQTPPGGVPDADNVESVNGTPWFELDETNIDAFKKAIRTVLKPGDRQILERALTRGNMRALMRKKINALHADNPAARDEFLRMLDDAEEGQENRIALGYLLWSNGHLTMDGPKAKSALHTFGDNLLGIMNLAGDGELAHQIFSDIATGVVSRIHRSGKKYDARKKAASAFTIAQRKGEAGSIGNAVNLQAALNRAHSAYDTVTEPLSKMFSSQLQRMRESGLPTMARIAAMIHRPQGATGTDEGNGKGVDEGMTPAINDTTAFFMRGAAKAMQGLTPRQQLRVVRMMQRQKGPDGKNADVDKAITRLRGVFDTAYDYLKERGVNVGERENFFPVTFDPNHPRGAATLREIYMAKDKVLDKDGKPVLDEEGNPKEVYRYEAAIREAFDKLDAKRERERAEKNGEAAATDQGRDVPLPDPDPAALAYFDKQREKWGPGVAATNDSILDTITHGSIAQIRRQIEMSHKREDSRESVGADLAQAFRTERRYMAARIKQLEEAGFGEHDGPKTQKKAGKQGSAKVERSFEELVDDLISSAMKDEEAIPALGGKTVPGFRSARHRLSQFVYDGKNETDIKKFASVQSADPSEIFASYFEPAIRRAEFAKRFGDDGSKLEALIERLKEEGATPAQIEEARNAIAAALGTYGVDRSPTLAMISPALADRFAGPKTRRFVEGAQAYQNVRLLPMALLSSLVDPMGIAVRTGGDFATAWDGFKTGMGTLFNKEKRENMRAALEMLGASDDIVPAIAAVKGFGKQAPVAKKVNDFVFRSNMMHSWVESTRFMALRAGNAFLIKHAAQAETNDTSRRYLAELGLTAEDVQTYEAPTGVGRQTRQEVVLNTKTRAALSRFVNEAVLRPHSQQSPLWYNDPYMGMVTQYKTFLYALADQIGGRIGREVSHENYKVLGAALSYMPIVMMAELLREFLQHGSEGNPNRKDWSADDYAWLGVERSGLLGPKTMTVLDAAQDRNSGRLPGTSFAGPSVGQALNVGAALRGHRDGGGELEAALPFNPAYKHWFNPTSDEVKVATPYVGINEAAANMR